VQIEATVIWPKRVYRSTAPYTPDFGIQRVDFFRMRSPDLRMRTYARFAFPANRLVLDGHGRDDHPDEDVSLKRTRMRFKMG
jgi:hypothetical protein